MIYSQPEPVSVADAEAMILRDAPEELCEILIAVSLYSEDFDWAQTVCVRLAAHPDHGVRGNALLGFGHLARRFGRLNRRVCDPLIRSGLQDPDAFVRGQAECAADDVAHSLGLGS